MTTKHLNPVVRRLCACLQGDAPQSTDAELLGRFRDHRDAAALETIVARHGPLVMAACRKVLTADADAEDAFQATFLILLQNPAAVRQAPALGAWLYGVIPRPSVPPAAPKSAPRDEPA